MNRTLRSTLRETLRATQTVALLAAGALFAPAALAQVPQSYCGTPPKAASSSIPFTDITALPGYVQLTGAADYPDFVGGGQEVGNSCYDFDCFSPSAETDLFGPWLKTYDVATISLPFPFGFSGIYSDGGSFAQPFQINVWSNGILTTDPSVSYDPRAFPTQVAPSDCEAEGECSPSACPFLTTADLQTTAVADTFGGFPFSLRYSPPNNPNALIAPWWGDLSVCNGNDAQIGWLLTLDDNNQPMAVIQWTNVTASQTETPNECPGNYSACLDTGGNPLKFAPLGNVALPQFSFQVRFHQNNDVDFVYGPASNLGGSDNCYEQGMTTCSYVSGIQSNFVYPSGQPSAMDYATQALDCDPVTGCAQSRFPSGTSRTFPDVFRLIGPDLQVVSIDAPGQVPQGGTVTVPVIISNGGGTDSSGQGTVQFYFSAGGTTPVGSPFSAQLVPSFKACSTAPMQAQVKLPSQVPQGGGYLIAEFVPGQESVDQNHSFAHAQIVVGPPGADVATVGALSFVPTAIVGGEQISVSFQVQNVGEVDASSVSYGIYLSPGGSSIATSDFQIGADVIADLPVGGPPVTVTKTLTVPATLVSGTYLVGAILNPSRSLNEINLANNDAIGSTLLTDTSPGPVIVTNSLLNARANSPYSVQLIAAGGDGHYTWSLSAGSLPAGLVLTSKGVIEGQAEAAGSSQFEVKVSDRLNRTTTEALTLSVDPFDQTLTIVTPSLPAGSTAQLYNFAIAATGGVPPYQWALVPGTGTVPAGISLLSNGLLTGEPQFDGSSSFQVTVTDAAGASATSPVLTLTVYAAGTLAVGTTVLPNGVLNKSYTQTLHYVGGTSPYRWTLLDVQREPSSPGDLGQDLGPNLPNVVKAGEQNGTLTFFPDQGEIEGVPSEVGVFAITVEVQDGETPPATATGLVLLTISSSVNFSFQTVQLPEATTNEIYSTQLVTTGNPDSVTCELLNTSLLSTRNADRTMPPGLTLYPDCSIFGQALLPGTSSILVEASDDQGGVATQSFTIQVANAPAAKAGGCQSAPGAPVFAGLILLALSGIRRRRAGEPQSPMAK